MPQLPKFTGEHEKHLEQEPPTQGTNRCPRCRYKKTVVASEGWRFCTLCHIQWQHVYLTDHFKNFWRASWNKAQAGGSSSSQSRSSSRAPSSLSKVSTSSDTSLGSGAPRTQGTSRGG